MAACLVVSVALLIGVIIAALADRLSAAAPAKVSPPRTSAIWPLDDLPQDLKRAHLA